MRLQGNDRGRVRPAASRPGTDGEAESVPSAGEIPYLQRLEEPARADGHELTGNARNRRRVCVSACGREGLFLAAIQNTSRFW
jgi:hypothetical protein